MMSATKRNSSSSAITTTSSKICCFCNLAEDNELEYGKFYDQDGIVTHYYCLLLSSNMKQQGKDHEGILGFLIEDIRKELRRGKKLNCSYCKKMGATLGCCNIKCKRIFHLPCGLKAGSLHQFFEEFQSFCINHRPKQEIDEYILKQISSLNEILCYICYDKVNPKDSLGTLWAPCCKKNAWFHRKCVQQLALSAGIHFFKCPLCNNNKDFQDAMKLHGIFIPSQDASWELVPNAFEELLYRHDHCDATLCLCPKGRKHTSSNAKWELVLCRICGSQGIHMGCGKLKWANPVWECDECTSILRNTKERNTPRSGEISDSSSLSRDSDSDESDSDISVGTDIPMLCSLPSPSSSSTLADTNFKSRPGPRSFKLQQQLKACGMIDSSVDTSCVSTPTSTPATNSTTNKSSKENNFAQKNNTDNSRQTSKKDHCVQEKKSLDNDVKSQLNSNVNDIITIESDDDDDVEIIALQRKISVPAVQIAWANMFRSSVSLKSDSNNSTENSIDKSTKEIDPLQTENQSREKQTPRDCDSTKESDVSKLKVSKSKVSNRRKITTSEQSNVIAPLEFTLESTRESIQEPAQKPTQELTQKSTQEPTQESTQEPTQISISSDDDPEVSEDTNSTMNIKIVNVTSLPPEVFASVPNVDLDEDITWLEPDTGDTSSAVIKPLKKWIAPQESSSTTMKRGIYEEANNAADNNYKRIKANSPDKTFTDTVVRDTWREQRQRAEPNVASNMRINEVIEDDDECTASITRISSPSSSISQKNDIFAQADTCKVNETFAIVESNHRSEKSDSPLEIALPQNSENNSMLYAPVIQSGNQIYFSVPSSNLFYAQPISSPTNLESDSTATLYPTTSSNIIRPPVIQSTATLSKHQSVVMAEPINTDVLITNNNQETEESSNQQAGLVKEKTTDDPSTDNDSSNRIVCDGDAGRTNPAVTPRPACFSEAGTADTSDALEITRREVEQRRDSPRYMGPRKTYKQKPCNESNTMHIMSIVSRIRSIRAQCSVFPRVTNNHNACHQPRLIPQYMHLHDLKFRVCGTSDIQMILYDMFSVNISVENPIKDNKIRPMWEPGPLTSQAWCEASSSLNHIDGDSLASHLTDDKTECITDATGAVAHDDAKENLDPISRTVSRNVISGNTSLMNGVDDADTTDNTRQREHGAQTCLVPSDINPNILGRTICNTSIDSNTGKDDDLSQGSRVDHQESVQRKQPTSATEESGWLPYRRTIHSIDSDLNIVHTNKNIEKIMQNNVTVTTNRRVDDKGSDGSRATDNSPTLRSHNLSYTTANHRKSSNHAHSDRTGVKRSRTRDLGVRSIPNIKFNEHSISNKQIDACDSSQLIRCMAFRENEDEYNNDPTVRVSIDLRKIQSLIDSKPELFASDEEDDDGNDRCRRRCRSRLRGEDNCTQQQTRFCDSDNDGMKHSSLKNGELQTLSRTSIEARDSPYASANTFNRYRKRERESRYFDRLTQCSTMQSDRILCDKRYTVGQAE